MRLSEILCKLSGLRGFHSEDCHDMLIQWLIACVLLCEQGREAAVLATVEEQLQRKAALEREVGALLQCHEHLTSQRPWHEQHVRLCSRLMTLPCSLHLVTSTTPSTFQ